MDAIYKQNHATQCEAWAQLGAVNRAAYIRKASGALADLTPNTQLAYQIFNHLILQTTHLDDVDLLQGATGETNDLYLAPRGKTMVVGTQQAKIIPVLAQLVAALLTGNEVILHYPSEPEVCQQTLDILRATGMLPEVIEVANDSQLATLLHINGLAVVAAVGNFAELYDISQILSCTDGVLTQVIPVMQCTGKAKPTDIQDNARNTDYVQFDCHEFYDPDYLQRFMTERVKTVNTTAIGGNASLIELGEG